MPCVKWEWQEKGLSANLLYVRKKKQGKDAREGKVIFERWRCVQNCSFVWQTWKFFKGAGVYRRPKEVKGWHADYEYDLRKWEGIMKGLREVS